MKHQEVIDFLNTDGGNPNLAVHLDKSEFRFGPIDYKISELKRIMGPEEGIKYPETPEGWEERVGKMVAEIKKGWKPKPLIATNIWENHFTVADGNHRHEALLRLGIETYPVVFYFRTKEDQEAFIKGYESSKCKEGEVSRLCSNNIYK